MSFREKVFIAIAVGIVYIQALYIISLQGEIIKLEVQQIQLEDHINTYRRYSRSLVSYATLQERVSNASQRTLSRLVGHLGLPRDGVAAAFVTDYESFKYNVGGPEDSSTDGTTDNQGVK